MFQPTFQIGQRVIVEVSRGNIIAGEIIQLDDSSVVILMSDGNEIPLTLEEVSRIIPLIDIGENPMGTVELRDGRRFHGTILKDGFEQVVLQVGGVEMEFQRRNVKQVQEDPPFEETYERLLKSLDPANQRQFQFLIEWLLYKDQLELAKFHLERSQIDSPIIDSLLSQVESKIEDKESVNEVEVEKVLISIPGEEKKRSRILTLDEVNLIRAYEADSSNPPPLEFSENARQQLLVKFADDPRFKIGSFFRSRIEHGSDQELFHIIRELRDVELYSELVSIGEPESLRRFRENVHDDWLINRCGTKACHGGIDCGILLLHRTPMRDDRSRYANLLTIERIQIDPAWPMINFDNPELSLLIQYGLDRDLAEKPHPETRGWKPVPELSKNDEFQAVVAWIKSMKQVPRPQYPIVYELNQTKNEEVPTK